MRRTFACIFILIFLSQGVSFEPSTALELELDIDIFIEEIIDRLVNDISYDDNGQILGWLDRYSTDKSNDKFDIMYQKGYTVGTSGIADVLLNYYNLTEVKLLVDNIISNFLTDLREEDKGISWQRFSNFLSPPWLGMRYGTMGILKFLTNYYVLTENATVMNTIDQALVWFISQRENNGYWPISEGDYITMDSEYGITGMGSQFIDMYQKLGNQTYLEYAKIMSDILFDLGQWDDDRFFINWAPLDLGIGYDDIYTSKNSGAAGTLDFMLDMYAVLNESIYLETAIGIGNDLVYWEKDGAFEHSSLHYITQIYSVNEYFIGYLAGSSGVAESLFKLYDITEEQTLLQTCANIELFVNSLNYENGSTSIGKELYTSFMYTGLDLGSTGLILYYSHLYERYGEERYLNRIQNLVNHLHELWIKYDGHIPVDENRAVLYGYSYNIEKGLAGVLIALENIKHLEFGNLYITDNYRSLFSQASSEASSKLSFSGFYLFVFVNIVIIKRKKKTFHMGIMN